MDLKVKLLTSTAKLPQYQTDAAAGADLFADLPDGSVVIMPGEHKLIPTGITFVFDLHDQADAIPEVQIRPRSGLAYKYAVTVLNSPGTIDADYTGNVGVILVNHGKEAFEVTHGDRIAQAVMTFVPKVNIVETDGVTETVRGAGGFGSTGT